MKKSLSLTILVSVFFAVAFTSCQKKEKSTEASNQKLTVEDATSYLQHLESKSGNYDLITVGGKTEKNFKSVDFSHAYIGENETSFFVEAPISYTRRAIALGASPGIPIATLKKMFSNSFDRFVIYKDKTSGLVNEKIVTVIPSADYVNNDHKDLYNNHYQSIVKEFTGYVSNKNWKGQFLSSQSYNLGNTGPDKRLASNSVAMQAKAASTNDLSCTTETIYQGYAWCEDFDQNGDPVNCDYVIIESEALVCDALSPVHNHSVPIPDPNDPYWQGWPDPQNIPSGSSCPTGPRYYESPIVYAAVALDGSTFSVSFNGGCFCHGYSFIILEDVATGTEYSFPIEIQNFILPDCTALWETNVQIPASVPNGEYFVKTWQDGDTFYHQFEKDGVIVRRFKHLLMR